MNQGGTIRITILTDRWVSAANPGDGKTPYGTNGSDWMLTDYVIEDGSYVALRSVILGYSLPAAISKRLKLNGLRVYASGENLLYIMSFLIGVSTRRRAPLLLTMLHH